MTVATPADGGATQRPDLRPAAPGWRHCHPGLWVAHHSGVTVGAVEFVDTFITTDARGYVVGTYDSLTDAQSALTTPPPASPHRRRPRFRGLFARGLG